jgi:hypothetical protein
VLIVFGDVMPFGLVMFWDKVAAVLIIPEDGGIKSP